MALIINTVDTRINATFLEARIYDFLACFENKLKENILQKEKKHRKILQ